MNQTIERELGPSGALAARKIKRVFGPVPGPVPARFAPTDLEAYIPAGLEPQYRKASIAMEKALRRRLAVKGFLRGLQGTGIFGVGRLYASRVKHTAECHRKYLEWILLHPFEPRFSCSCPRVNLGLVCTKVITDAGVAFLVDDWDNNGQDLTTLNYHGCGTGTNAEAVGDTALQTESTTALNPDSTRATGTRSQPAANQYRSVGTLTFDAGAAITEHGLLSQAATGGGTLWDRSVFSAINVVSADSIQFTYTATVSSGG